MERTDTLGFAVSDTFDRLCGAAVSRNEQRVGYALVAGLLLSVATAAFAGDGKLSPVEQQGRALAERMCSRCHAIGRSGASPHPAAPAFRSLDRRIDLDEFADRLREGLVGGHPDMPMVRFTREDARALTSYVRAVQGP